MNDNGSARKSASRRPPVALFVWLGIFLVIGLFFLLSNGSDKKTKTLTPNQFVVLLDSGKIISAEVTTGPERFFLIKGEYTEQSSTEKNNTTSTEKNLSDGERLKYEVNIPATDALIEKLQGGKVPHVKYEEDDSWWHGLILNVIIGIVIVAILYFIFARQMRGSGGGALQFGKSRARMIMPDDIKTRFDDVAGCEEAKAETKEIVDYLRDPLKYKLLGGRIPKGALLTGPPGTGKTLMAKAVAGEANVPFFSISGSDFIEMFVGVGASRVRDMFDQARKNAPSVIFIDEIDAVGRSRFSGIGGGHDEREQTLNAMLVEMDGLESLNGAVIVLAATNRVDVLDPALLRPGRFDRQIVIDLPDIRGRRKILDVHAKNVKLATDVDLDSLARSTPGFSGADLANLMNEAALLAARYDHKAATQADLEEARDKVCFGAERRSRVIPDHERKLTAYHEAGHALVNIHCKHGTPLHKVTIIPRGQALGLTMMMDHVDRYSRTKNEMLDTIAMSLGGRVAEELVLEDISSGASQDIAHATNIAHAMVCSFGMSDKLGPVKYGERSEHIYVGRDITRNDSCSEETLREIDLEVKSIVSNQKDRATAILTEHRDQLEKLANALLEKETMDAKQVYELLDMPMPGSESKKEQSAVVENAEQNEPLDELSTPEETTEPGITKE